MKRNSFLTGMVVGILVSVVLFGILDLQAADHGKKEESSGHGAAKKEESGGHGAKKEEGKAEAKAEGGHGAAKEDKKEEKKEEGGHGAKKEEKSAGGHGGGKKEEAVVEEKPIDRKKFTYHSSVQFLEDLDEDEGDGTEDGSQEEPVKTVYVMPDKCREYSMYLETKRKSLDRMEKKLKSQKRMIESLKKDVESGSAKFLATEERIKTLTAIKSGDLTSSNPELTKMIKLYETISAEEAAELLQNLDLDLTVAILKGMQPKKVSKIMTALDPKISAALSSQMVRGF